VNTLLLCYHRVLARPPSDNIHILASTTYERQIGLLAKSGLSVADPKDFGSTAPSAGHRIGLTFDDGYKSDLRSAEILARHNMKGLFFISSANIGLPEYMDAAEIRTLVDMGMAIGSHAHFHEHLTPTSATSQASTSRDILSQVIGKPVDDFAFPGGVCTAETIKLVHQAGYKRVHTLVWGVNGDSDVRSGVLRRNCLVQNMTDDQFMQLITAKNQALRQAFYFAKRAALKLLPHTAYRKLQRWYGASGKEARS
jgi:peptidoglycan/xylan/chitin deacetylase (PgdA/CDA1 family)